MNTNESHTIIEAPELNLPPNANAYGVIRTFFESIGWNKIDYINPSKIRTSSELLKELHATMLELHPNNIVEIGMLYVSRGPGMDDDLTKRQVRLIDGWIVPANEHETKTADKGVLI